MSTAFLFPGQGAQTPQFLRELPDHPLVDQTLATATEILDQDIRALSDASALLSTEGVQPAIFVAGIACARALQSEGCAPQLVAGLSVGTFAAAVIAGAIAFEDALPLVVLRAQLMAGAFPSGYGLAAITGIDEARVRAMLHSCGAVYLAAVNAPTQIVLAGSDAALDAAIAQARTIGATSAARLAVAVPSHCVLLEPVAARLDAALARIDIRAPQIEYIGNRRARVLRTAVQVREELATNVTHLLRWDDSTTLARELGATLFLEMPPGQTLTALAQSLLEQSTLERSASGRSNAPGTGAYAMSQLTLEAACDLSRSIIEGAGY